MCVVFVTHSQEYLQQYDKNVTIWLPQRLLPSLEGFETWLFQTMTRVVMKSCEPILEFQISIHFVQHGKSSSISTIGIQLVFLPFVLNFLVHLCFSF